MTLPAQALTLYGFGNPTSEEQLYIELINRARANPTAEGARLAATTDPYIKSAYTQYGVNLTTMQSEFSALPALPPLAPSAGLMSSARVHSAWMLSTGTQAHDETNPANTPWDRITNAGYVYYDAGENIFASSKNTWHGHAGFQVDWGTGGTGGMQAGRGHRANIHSAAFREIGVGVTAGTNGAVGPQQVTQDFGSQWVNPTLGTGVAYYDLDSNNAFDAGEGISGLTVNVSGATYYCNTAAGGGWVVQVPDTAATRTVTFSGLNLNQNVSLVVPASTNAKADLKLAYTPPAITSTSSPTAGSSHTVTFNAIGGATGYTLKRSAVSAASAENCENTSSITASTTGTYTVLNTVVKNQGTASFHLANAGATQSFELNTVYFGQASPTLSFQSLLAFSKTTESYKVQIKEEGGVVWQDVYSQVGFGGSGEGTFSLRSVPLTGMAGKGFKIRFLVAFGSGSFYTPSDSVGWFIDAISFSGVSALSGTVSQSLAGTSGSFTPSAGTLMVAVAPVISGRDFPASYQTLTVTAAVPPGFATWAAGIETTGALAAGTISNPNLDYDKDGRSNLMEYAFGCSPVSASDPASRMPLCQVTSTHYVLRYLRDTALTDVTLTPQACSSLGNWKAPGDVGAPAGFADTLISTTGTVQTREARIPRTTPGNLFMRVKVAVP